MDTLLHLFIFSTLVGECEYYCIEMKVGINYSSWLCILAPKQSLGFVLEEGERGTIWEHQVFFSGEGATHTAKNS